MALSGVFIVNSYLQERSLSLLLLSGIFAVLFIWLFGMALRLPTSFVAISQDRIRIRFGGFVDQTFETKEVAGAELVSWPWWRGLGVRTSFGGDVALVAAGGPSAQIHLRQPLRVWLIPRVWRIRATRVVLSVRNPHKMVERFGSVPSAQPGAGRPRPKPRRKGATR
jgi:hypothetical protein